MFYPHRHGKIRGPAVGAIAITILIAIVGVTTFAVSSASSGSQTRQPETLTNPNFPFPTNARLDPTNAAIAHRDATARVEVATTFARNPVKAPTHTPPPNVIQPGEVVGLIAGPLPPDYGPAFRSDAIIENFWRQFPNDNLFVIVAGAVKSDPQQGFVGVATFQKTGLVALNKSLTPTKHGSVHITAVNGSLVTLIATDGTTFIFDDTTYTFK